MQIEVKNLTCVFSPGSAFEHTALSDISFTIPSGSFVGIIGHTGSGKSTLIQHLNVLLHPTSGQILLDGADINADKSRYKTVRQLVGLVFQYPEHQLFEMTVYKDVAFGPANIGCPKEEVDARVRRALETAGIGEELFEKSPFELSGGQKRRVAIAGVLAMEPKVLILDEPTAGLDPQGRDEILDKIKEMRERLGITVILVSHSMEDVARLVEYIIVMNGGKIERMGTPAEIFANPARLEEIGLAAPQISSLMRALNEKGVDVPTDIFTVDDAEKVLSEVIPHV